MVNIKFGFQNIHDIPQCYGAIDYSHILFDKYIDTNGVDWCDRDHNYNMILQAIVDSKSRFIDVFARFLGSVYDSRVFSRFNHQLLVIKGKNLNGVIINIQDTG